MPAPKRKPATRSLPAPDMRPNCSVCNAMTPHMVKGVRFCVEHHPQPDQHIRAAA